MASITIIAALGAFYGGMHFSESRTTANQQRSPQGVAGAGFRGARSGGRAGGDSAAGEIINKDAGSLTVKLRDGGSKIIFFSDTTQIGKVVSGAPADLEIGKSVMASGKANTDGSISAESIQLRPQMSAQTLNQNKK